MAKTSPTSRSLSWLRERGWTAEVVEKTLHMPGRPWGNKKDLFGFIDIVAVEPGGELLFVQVTSGSNLAARVAKAKSVAPETLRALASNPTVLVHFHGWRKVGKKGKRKLWELRRVGADGKELG